MAKNGSASTCEVIRKDHDDIKKLLQKFDSADNAKDKETIVQELAAQLTEHSRVGEALIFPAAAQISEDEAFVNDLKEQDNSVKMHLAQVQRLYADIDKEEFSKKMSELRKAVCDLIEGEESKLIPCMENANYDLNALNEEVAKLRAGESGEPVKLKKLA